MDLQIYSIQIVNKHILTTNILLTYFFSIFKKVRIFCGDDYIENEPKLKEEMRPIHYWDLFVQRCIQESKTIQRKNWITSDDVLSISSTSTIAIPGNFILSNFIKGGLILICRIISVECPTSFKFSTTFSTVVYALDWL